MVAIAVSLPRPLLFRVYTLFINVLNLFLLFGLLKANRSADIKISVTIGAAPFACLSRRIIILTVSVVSVTDVAADNLILHFTFKLLMVIL